MGPVRSLLYALGVAGYCVADRVVVILLLYFYLPPGGHGLPPQVPLEPFWGPLTAFGVAMVAGRVVDALSDPLVGYASDRSRARCGRRRAFMAAGLVPMVALPLAAFWPPYAPGSPGNAVYLGALLAGFFAAFTAYVAPLLALLPELETGVPGRARLSALVGGANLVGLLGFAPLAFAALEALQEGGLAALPALRAVAMGAAVVALALCALPLLAIDEHALVGRTAPAAPSAGLRASLARTLGNKAFLRLMVGQVFLVLATHLAAPIPVYLATAVLGRSEGFAALLSATLLATTLLALAALRPVTARHGPRPALIGACLLAVPCLAVWGLLRPAAPGAPGDALNLALAFGSLALLGVAVAGFAALPYLLISQLIDADCGRGEAPRAAMFFGMQGLLLKWVYGVGSAILAYLFARYGSSASRPDGVLLVGPLAALCCALAAGGFAWYPERAVLARAAAARSAAT
jgi:GPH family glycoside/pentoside/hexuronide:cation symporter